MHLTSLNNDETELISQTITGEVLKCFSATNIRSGQQPITVETASLQTTELIYIWKRTRTF